MPASRLQPMQPVPQAPPRTLQVRSLCLEHITPLGPWQLMPLGATAGPMDNFHQPRNPGEEDVLALILNPGKAVKTHGQHGPLKWGAMPFRSASST